MSIDFFNEGFKKQPIIQYSKEEQTFFASKLPFLDPKKTNNIQIGSVTQFCTMGQIKGAIIKKILTNCKLDGKRLVTYDQMKKVFRAISLVQKGYEPSWINITANIKLPMPRLDDDYSDQEEQTSKKVEKQPIKTAVQPQNQPVPKIEVAPPPPPPTSQAKVAQFAQFGQFLAKPSNNQPKPQKQQIQKPKPVQPEKNQSQSNNLKQFQAYWSTLNTKNNKIDGGQVKQICKNLAQRSNLSKAWKLCCISHQGTLTKGEFYVFLLIVKMNNVPESLSAQMKEAINKIDKGSHKSAQKQKPRTESQLGASQMFDNFGKSQLSITNQHYHKPTSQPAIQRPSSNQILSQLSTKITGKFQQTRKQLAQQQKSSEQQLLQLRRQQQIMNNMMGEVEQFVISVNTRNNKIRREIDELKGNQLAINQRFNNVCMAMNQVIVKQNSFIQELLGQISEQNNINSQKAVVLENYVVHTEASRAHTEETYRKQVKVPTAVFQSQPQKLKPSITIIEPTQSREVIHPPVSPRYQSPVSQRENFTSPPAPQPSPVAQEDEHQSPQTKHQKEQQQEVVPPQQHQEVNLSQQQIQDQNRIKMKQMQLIQLINYLSPITPSQYPQIVKKITSYHQSALNQAYQKLYMKIKQKQMLQQQRARQAAAAQNNPAPDDFSSSNFNHEQNNQGTNFFG